MGEGGVFGCGPAVVDDRGLYGSRGGDAPVKVDTAQAVSETVKAELVGAIVAEAAIDGEGGLNSDVMFVLLVMSPVTSVAAEERL